MTTIDRELDPWCLTYDGYEPSRRALHEALCTLGNGYVATRGALDEVDAGGPHSPGTYLAGGYDRAETEIEGKLLENEDLVNWPNWLPVTFRMPSGKWFAPDAVDILQFRIRLDLRQALLCRHERFRDDDGNRFDLRCRRMVHMGRPHLAATEWTLTSLDWEGDLEFRTALDGDVVNSNVERYRDLEGRHVEIVETGVDGEDVVFLTARTRQSRVLMSQASRTRLFEGDDLVPVRRRRRTTPARAEQRLHQRHQRA